MAFNSAWRRSVAAKSSTGMPHAHSVAAICLVTASASHGHPALQFHTQLQLIPARVSVQTLTEHDPKREGRSNVVKPVRVCKD